MENHQTANILPQHLELSDYAAELSSLISSIISNEAQASQLNSEALKCLEDLQKNAGILRNNVLTGADAENLPDPVVESVSIALVDCKHAFRRLIDDTMIPIHELGMKPTNDTTTTIEHRYPKNNTEINAELVACNRRLRVSLDICLLSSSSKPGKLRNQVQPPPADEETAEHSSNTWIDAPPAYNEAVREPSTNVTSQKEQAPSRDGKSIAEKDLKLPDSCDPGSNVASRSNSANGRSDQTPAQQTLRTNLLLSITRDLVEANSELQGVRLFEKCNRIVVRTRGALAAYDISNGNIAWRLHNSLTELGRGSGGCFGQPTTSNFDTSLICSAIGSKAMGRELLLIDTETGHIKNRHNLHWDDGNLIYCSQDRSKIAVLHVSREQGHSINIIPILQGRVSRRPSLVIPIKEEKCVIVMAFTPDNKYIVTCVASKTPPPSDKDGNSFTTRGNHEATAATIIIRTFFSDDGALAQETVLPYISQSPPDEEMRGFVAQIHFSGNGEWFISYTTDSREGTNIVNGKTGELVGIISARLSIQQFVRSGFGVTKSAQHALDPETNTWTRLERRSTMWPGKQTLCITRAVPNSSDGRISTRPGSQQTVILSIGARDRFSASQDGTRLGIVRHGGNAIDIYSVEGS